MKIKSTLCVALIFILFILPYSTADIGIGIKQIYAYFEVEEGQEVCMPFGVLNPGTEKIQAYLDIGGDFIELMPYAQYLPIIEAYEQKIEEKQSELQQLESEARGLITQGNDSTEIDRNISVLYNEIATLSRDKGIYDEKVAALTNIKYLDIEPATRDPPIMTTYCLTTPKISKEKYINGECVPQLYRGYLIARIRQYYSKLTGTGSTVSLAAQSPLTTIKVNCTENDANVTPLIAASVVLLLSVSAYFIQKKLNGRKHEHVTPSPQQASNRFRHYERRF